MDMTQAAIFLAGSILIMIGMIVIISGAVVINQILQKYWKPVRIFTPDSWAAFNPPEARMEPNIGNKLDKNDK
jgi:hypothetical protein